MTDLAGRLSSALERYQIQRELGRGGMAVVYLGRDVRYDRVVAIKVMHPEVMAGAGRDRFLREIRIAATLSHPHILPLFDSGEADGLLYYVMPYVDGESLRARIARSATLPV
jgi:serine/threonine-protein kinase